VSDDSIPETPELVEAARAALDDVESRPLAERASGYRSLADALRAELEQSDPSRSAG
jgi:acyl-CoA reductase-like NAD-dependent aldehyde dehydrogenase